jgi:hypothetical protein
MNRMSDLSTHHCWKKENFCRVAYCGNMALPGHPRDVLAGLFVPLGESEEKFLFSGKAGVMLVLRRTNACCHHSSNGPVD